MNSMVRDRLALTALRWRSAGVVGVRFIKRRNEVAVAEFLAGRLGFAAIPSLVEASLDAAARRGIVREPASVEEALAIDRTVREIAATLKSSASAGLH